MFWLALAFVCATATSAELPDYVRRGNEVESNYREYTKRLEKDYSSLKSAVQSNAPDLLKALEGQAPKPVAVGYQLVPTLTVDIPKASGKNARAVSTPYSWGRTDQFIGSERPKLEDLEGALAGLSKLDAKNRRAVLEKALADYPQLESNQKLIDHHIQYNRFWQKKIAEDRPHFDKLTHLHDLVLERQQMIDTGDEKERFLAKQIHDESDYFSQASFVKIKHPKTHTWIFEVPIYTDIQDKKFVTEMKDAIERVWYVEDREDTYKVALNIHVLSTKQLYKQGSTPHKGQKIDVAKHAEHFPKDGGVITTGAETTFAIPTRYIALGPQDIAQNVIAHEFGHILGFIDGYFRGYHDLGKDGFEVLEVIPDPDDIMCTPESGHVRKFHFERMIKAANPKA